MRVFLINLDKNKDRLAQSTLRLNALDVSFERIGAIYGKELLYDEKRKAVNKFRWWCAQGRKIRDGEIGCALSHFKIYRRMLREGIDYACILEDDNIYENDFKVVLDKLEAMIDISKPQVVLLSNCDKYRVDSCSDESGGVRLVSAKNDSGAFAYVITALAAKGLLQANFPMHVPCDYWKRWVSRGIIALYHICPTVCRPESRAVFGSDIETPDMERVSEFGPVKWLVHKAKRLMGVMMDSLLPL